MPKGACFTRALVWSLRVNRSQLIEMFRYLATEIAEKDFSGLLEASVVSEMGVDSLAMLEVIGEMERELDIQIPDDDLAGIETVGELLDVVERQMRQAP